MSQEIFWVLLSKKLSGEASDAELRQLENLILEHPEWQYAIQNLGDLWKHQAPIDNSNADDAYLLHLHRMKEMNISFDDVYSSEQSIPLNNNRFKKWYWAAAAAIVFAIGLFGFNKLYNKSNPALQATNELNEISTRPGSKSKIQLPDGSVVWLNAGSKLTYNKEYGQQLREVTLTGEGYFDVVKNKEKPFIIHTSSINIKVLGTAFNVKAYPEDKQTETTLIHGRIEVTINKRPDDPIILSPNEKLIVENEFFQKKEEERAGQKYEQPAISINKVKLNPVDSTVAETQWIENKLVFNDESFADLAVRMERWYDVEIHIDSKDAQLLQKRITGNFEKESVDQALEALREMIPLMPFKIEKQGNKIIIHR